MASLHARHESAEYAHHAQQVERWQEVGRQNAELTPVQRELFNLLVEMIIVTAGRSLADATVDELTRAMATVMETANSEERELAPLVAAYLTARKKVV